MQVINLSALSDTFVDNNFSYGHSTVGDFHKNVFFFHIQGLYRFQQYYSYIMVVSCMNTGVPKKTMICRKLLTNFIT